MHIFQGQGEGSVHMQENGMSEQKSSDFCLSTTLMSGPFPLFSFFPIDEHCFQ